MESPSLSRSPSATFAPGPHRRSHPNLHHLSLAPLTPKYPIDPADYDAYFDPVTSELHTSTSLSKIASLPSPGGILTTSPARSRASSRIRRKVKSTVSIREPPHGALTSEGFGYTSSEPASKPTKTRSQLKLHTDPSWFIQTGLALTEGSRESKGQSWIVKRESSTSLFTPAEETPTRSGRVTPRSKSGRRSKRDLAMTPAAHSTLETPADDDVIPDWADARTQAEIAAQVQEDLAEEFDFDDADPYGILDFDGQFESSDDEEQVREAISRYKLGQWMDGMVDAMLKIEERNQPLEDDTEDTGGELSDTAPSKPSHPPKSEMSWWMRLMGNAFTRV